MQGRLKIFHCHRVPEKHEPPVQNETGPYGQTSNQCVADRQRRLGGLRIAAAAVNHCINQVDGLGILPHMMSRQSPVQIV